MGYIYKNITGTTATELIEHGAKDVPFTEFELDSIMLCNIHSTDAVSVSLYITKQENDLESYRDRARNDWTEYDKITRVYYILHKTKLPAYTTLKLDKDEIAYDMEDYSLYILLSAVDSAVDVIINTALLSESSKRKQKIKFSSTGNVTGTSGGTY